jgi:alkanesulfonate monooxygenase SsuD/methylene tetrahydromethanopterin reductase-like flavin-dependent oxidoreductase (luciferase family)
MAMILLREGHLIPVPSVETAQRFLAEREGRRDAGPARRRRVVIGAPGTVRAGIEEVADLYGAEEIIVVTITHDHAARVRSYELIAEAFGLTRAADPVGAHARLRA